MATSNLPHSLANKLCLTCSRLRYSIEFTTPHKFYIFSDSAVDAVDGDQQA